ncbi:MAG: phosphatase PAP2 family protein [Chloroflexi bacterium]|nr:phosphatase PAP2 family protein [Chloroflexota bacterium]
MVATVINRSITGVSWKSGLLAAGILGTLALFILAWAYPTFPGDEAAILRFQALRTGWLDDVSVGFAKLGQVWVFLPAALVLFGGLLIVRRYADAALAVACLSVFGTGSGLKLLVDRPRPEYQLFDPLQTNPSFPSGHALLAVMIGGALVYLVGRSVKPLALRRAIQVVLILAVLAMGASRVYLGLHWPSDVIGSYAFGVMALVSLIGLRNAVATA